MLTDGEIDDEWVSWKMGGPIYKLCLKKESLSCELSCAKEELREQIACDFEVTEARGKSLVLFFLPWEICSFVLNFERLDNSILLLLKGELGMEMGSNELKFTRWVQTLGFGHDMNVKIQNSYNSFLWIALVRNTKYSCDRDLIGSTFKQCQENCQNENVKISPTVCLFFSSHIWETTDQILSRNSIFTIVYYKSYNFVFIVVFFTKVQIKYF